MNHINPILAFWNRITSPRIPLSEPDERFRIQLFTSVILAGLILTIVVGLIRLPVQNNPASPEMLLRLSIAIALLGFYHLSRYGYIRKLSIGLAIFASASLFGLTIFSPLSQHDALGLNYLIVIVLSLSVFLPFRTILLIFFGQMIGLFLVPLFSELTFKTLLNGPISLNFTLGIFLLLIIQYRKQLEDIRQRTLRLSEENYRTLTDNAPVEIVRLNRNREITYINRSMIPDELPVEQIVGQRIVDFVLEEDRSLFQQKLDDLFQNNQTGTCEFRTAIIPGQIQTYQITMAPVMSNGIVNEGILIALNITAERQARLALEENEARYQTVVSALAEGVMVQNQNGDIIACNQSAVEILGLADQLNEMASLDPHRRSIHEDGSEFPAEEHPSMVTLRTGEPIKGAIMGIYHADGELRWISINSQPLLHQGENKPYAVVASFTDITESRKYLHDLQQNSAMLQALLNAPTDSVTLLRIDGKILAHNETALARTPNVPEDATTLVGLNMLDLVEPQVYQTVIDSIEIVVSSRDLYRYQIQQNRRWFDLVMFPIFDPDGEINRVGTISREISEQKLLEFSLKQSLEQLESFFTSSNNGIVFIDYDRAIDPAEIDDLTDAEIMDYFNAGIITKANPAWIKMFKGEGEPLIGRRVDEIFAIANNRIGIRRELLEKGELATIMEQRLHDGTSVWVDADLVCIRDIEGRIVGQFSTQRDITERKHEEERRFEEERARVLANFAQDAIHEFRTPLSAILLATHMLGKSNEPELIERRVDRIREQVERIQTLVDDLGDISQLDNSTPVLKSTTSINDLINSTFLATREQYDELGLQFHITLADQPGEVMVNEHQIRLALTKLLDNAVRYTPDGGSISVHTQIVTDEFHLEVKDTGIGIEAEHIPHIFKRFYRVDVAHRTQGFGLGLATVQLIVERHNGEINVVSTPGKGSTFTIRLPLTTKETPEPTSPQPGTSR